MSKLLSGMEGYKLDREDSINLMNIESQKECR